jgi:hypothetical protein
MKIYVLASWPSHAMNMHAQTHRHIHPTPPQLMIGNHREIAKNIKILMKFSWKAFMDVVF